MKQFGSLLLAAVLGSVITIAAVEWLGEKKATVKIEHMAGAPVSQVGFRVNEKGETVPLDFTAVAEKVTAAVVHIKSTSRARVSSRESNDPMQFFFGPNGPAQRGPSQSSGSGVIINPDGYIVTNNHVVEDADIVDVTLADNRSYKAEVIGTDTDTDLAVIRISQKDLPYLSFVDSDKAKVGEWVLAVGNPFNLNSTVTAGIISAKGRNINIINSNNSNSQNPLAGRTAIESFIQTDAAINPGNSGGALVDLNGGLLGINTAIASPTGAYSGYGFAVPSDIVSKVAEDLIGHGVVQRGWLGISVSDINSELAREFDLTVNEGAYVGGFSEEGQISAAKEAGVKQGDVVVKLDETPIRSSTGLIEYIGRRRPGDKVSVTVNRKGKTMVIPVTLKKREGSAEVKPDAVPTLGISLEDVEPGKLKRLELPNGVRVKEITDGKIDRYTDMKAGFIITQVDDVKVKSVKEINDLLKKKKSGELVTFSGVYEDYLREYIYAVRM